MVDYSALSDAQIDELHKQKMAAAVPVPAQVAPPKINYDNLTDAEIDALHKQKMATATPQEIPKIIQEMHPDLTTKILGMDTGLSYDRALTKNFANSAKSTIDYLKQERPNMEVKEQDGQITMRNPGEKDYHVLDPNTGVHPITGTKEFINDTLDLPWDIGSGIVANAAQKGSLPIAASGGAAANAGLEYVKQKLGKALGIPQEVNNDDVKLAGLIGAASPVVFGSSALPPEARSALKDGISKLPEFAQQFMKPLANESAEGLLKKGIINAGAMASGRPATILRTAYDKLKDIKLFEQKGISDFVDTAHAKIKSGFSVAKKKVWDGIDELLGDSKDVIDLTGAKNAFKKYIAEEKESLKTLNNQEARDVIERAEKTYEQYFGKNKPASKEYKSVGPKGMVDEFQLIEKPEEKELARTTARGARKLQQQLVDLADLHNSKPGIVNRFTNKDAADRGLGLAATNAYMAIKRAVDGAIDGATNKKISAQVFDYVKSQGRDITKMTPEELSGIRESIARNFKLLRDHKAEYNTLSNLQKEVAPIFSSPNRTYNTLRTMDGKNKQYVRESLRKMDNLIGTNTVDEANTIHAFSEFSKAPTNPISSEAVTATAKAIPLQQAGMGAGAIAGLHVGGYPGLIIGQYMGGRAGSYLGSPSGMRAAMEIGKVGEKVAKKIPDAAKQSLWNLMMNANNTEK